MYTIVNTSDIELGNNDDIIGPNVLEPIEPNNRVINDNKNCNKNYNKMPFYKGYIAIFIYVLLSILMFYIIIQLTENSIKIYKFDKKTITCKYVNETKAMIFCETGTGKLCERYNKCLKAIDEFSIHYLFDYFFCISFFIGYMCAYVYLTICEICDMYKLHKGNTVIKYILSYSEFSLIYILDIMLLLWLLIIMNIINNVNSELNIITSNGQSIINMLNSDKTFRQIIAFYPIVNILICTFKRKFLNVLN